LVSISIINKFPGITTYLFNAGAYFKSARSVKKIVTDELHSLGWVFAGGDAAGGQGTAYVNAGNAMLLQTYKPPKTSRCGMRGAFRKHLEGAFST